MAIDWRGWRAFAIGDRRFRWRCSFNYRLDRFSVGYAEQGALWPPDQLIICSEDRWQQRLIVSWPACMAPAVQPCVVREYIDEALRRGWLREHPILELTGSKL